MLLPSSSSSDFAHSSSMCPNSESLKPGKHFDLGQVDAKPTTATSALRISAIGESGFPAMRKQKQFYVDKTEFGARLLQYKRAVLLRPPRMGKTLFISMVECLFDVRYKDDFDYYFEGLHAHAHKLQEFNSFHVITSPCPWSLATWQHMKKGFIAMRWTA